MSTRRLLFGVPMILLGLCWISIGMGLLIESARDQNSKMSFPVLIIIGVTCVWLGYRLIFRNNAPQ